MEWKPISDDQKDGRRYLLYGNGQMDIGSWEVDVDISTSKDPDSGEIEWRDNSEWHQWSVDFEPSHYMRLPPGPNSD